MRLIVPLMLQALCQVPRCQGFVVGARHTTSAWVRTRARSAAAVQPQQQRRSTPLHMLRGGATDKYNPLKSSVDDDDEGLPRVPVTLISGFLGAGKRVHACAV
jgi:hypothetical protein